MTIKSYKPKIIVPRKYEKGKQEFVMGGEQIVVPEHLVNPNKILELDWNELRLFVDEETAYQVLKQTTKWFEKRVRRKEMDGEITE